MVPKKGGRQGFLAFLGKKIMAICICSRERAKTIICFVLTPNKDRFRAGARTRALAPNRPSGVLGKYHTNGACG